MNMNKKRFYTITTICLILILAISEIVIYNFAKACSLIGSSKITIIMVAIPIIIVALSFLRDFIINKLKMK